MKSQRNQSPPTYAVKLSEAEYRNLPFTPAQFVKRIQEEPDSFTLSELTEEQVEAIYKGLGIFVSTPSLPNPSDDVIRLYVEVRNLLK